MGMDVYGIQPKNKKGEYFRAAIWAWGPIYNIMCYACEIYSLCDARTLELMCSNDGAGLDNQEDCNRLADAMSDILNDPRTLEEHGLQVSGDGTGKETTYSYPIKGDSFVCHLPTSRLLSYKEAKKLNYPLDDLISSSHTNREHVEEFIEFLRNCGGFQVN